MPVIENGSVKVEYNKTSFHSDKFDVITEWKSQGKSESPKVMEEVELSRHLDDLFGILFSGAKRVS